MPAAAGSPLFALDGVTPTETATLQVRVWDSSKFSSFADAVTVVAKSDYRPLLTIPFLWMVTLLKSDRASGGWWSRGDSNP